MSEARWRRLDWDTTHFGISVARLEGSVTPAASVAFLEWCRREEIRCATYLADVADVESLRAAARSGFEVVDVRVELEWSEPRGSNAGEVGSAEVRCAAEGDLAVVESWVEEIAVWSRFHRDARFRPGAAAEMYRCWLRGAAAGGRSELLVAEGPSGEIDGLTTVETDAEGNGRIVLLGVRSGARGRGTGAALVAAARHWFASRGVATARVATQGANRAALRLYEAGGFRHLSLALWMHLWLESAP